MRTTLQALWLFAPLLVSAALSGAVIRLGWWRALARPIDAGRAVRGRRLFGDSKTERRLADPRHADDGNDLAHDEVVLAQRRMQRYSAALCGAGPALQRRRKGANAAQIGRSPRWATGAREGAVYNSKRLIFNRN